MTEKAGEVDVSWHRRPRRGHVRKVHIVGRDGQPACGMHVLLVDDDIAADSVHPLRRCQRPGCRQKWA